MSDHTMNRIQRSSEHTAMPWANGGGITFEVASSPAGADFTSFNWRISMAEVRESGPFSTFSGVDRVLTVLGPGDLTLLINDNEVLSRRHEPRHFSGDDDVRAELVDGPITDLNVMTRRGRCTGVVTVQTIDGVVNLEPQSQSNTVVVVLAGTLDLVDGEGLSVRDVLFLHDNTTIMGNATIARIDITDLGDTRG